MRQKNYDLDRRGGSFRFFFAIPPERGEKFLNSVKQNPDLIETTFQKVYPGFTGEDRVRRIATQQAHLVEVSWSKQQGYMKPQTKIGTIQFSKPVGEFSLPLRGTH